MRQTMGWHWTSPSVRRIVFTATNGSILFATARRCWASKAALPFSILLAKSNGASRSHERRNPGVDFQTLKELYFADRDGKITLNQISPRCFEAAALRTLLVMYEGDYSGRMQPWRHYVPLKKDHSNHEEVVALLKDPKRATEIIETAYQEVACNPDNTFSAFVSQFDGVVSAVFRPEQCAALPYLDDRKFETLSAPGWVARRRWVTRHIIEAGHRLLFSTVLGRARPETREIVQAWLKFFLYPLRVVWAQLRS